jgi:NAD(P)-dependent dehydrogenase (short-subunit alcohol dehydrogenase family)
MGAELFTLAGKKVTVAGGASGMGAETARLAVELGAEVTVMDFAPVTNPAVRPVGLDLRDEGSIDAAIDECGPMDVLFSCAGVGNGVPGLERVNFIGQRHLIDGIIGRGYLPAGGAIGIISSVAGLGWENIYDNVLRDYLDTPDFASAVAWIGQHEDLNTYGFSKRAMCAYVARQAFPLLKRGLRINSIMPGPTDTPMAAAHPFFLEFAQDYRDATGAKVATPENQASALIFLGLGASSHLSGVNILVDAGYAGAGLTGAFPAPAVLAMLGRS